MSGTIVKILCENGDAVLPGASSVLCMHCVLEPLRLPAPWRLLPLLVLCDMSHPPSV